MKIEFSKTNSYQIMGDVIVTTNEVYYHTSDWFCKLEIKNSERRKYKITASPTYRRKRRIAKKFPQIVQKMLTGQYLSIDEMQLKSFIYHIFHLFIELSALEKKSTLVHGATLVNQNGIASILTGWGGAGKTTSTINLIKYKNFKGLSDDITYIDRNSRVYFNPLLAHIYPYNVKDFKWLDKKMKNVQKLSDRLNWKFFGRKSKGAVRRLPLEMVYGREGVYTDSAILGNVLFLVREKGFDGINVSNLTPEQMSEQMASVMMWELKSYVPLLSAVNASSFNVGLPKISDLEKMIKNSLYPILKDGVNLKLIKVGDNVSSETLAEEIYMLCK